MTGRLVELLGLTPRPRPEWWGPPAQGMPYLRHSGLWVLNPSSPYVEDGPLMHPEGCNHLNQVEPDDPWYAWGLTSWDVNLLLRDDREVRKDSRHRLILVGWCDQCLNFTV